MYPKIGLILLQRPENIELSASRDTKLSVYAMNDQVSICTINSNMESLLNS